MTCNVFSGTLNPTQSIKAGSPSNSVAGTEAYLRAMFHLDPSNPLATVHQRYRQDIQTDRQRTDSTRRTVLQTVAQKYAIFTLSLPVTILKVSIKSPLSRGVTTAGDTGDASPVRPTMSPLHQNNNRRLSSDLTFDE